MSQAARLDTRQPGSLLPEGSSPLRALLSVRNSPEAKVPQSSSAGASGLTRPPSVPQNRRPLSGQLHAHVSICPPPSSSAAWPHPPRPTFDPTKSGSEGNKVSVQPDPPPRPKTLPAENQRRTRGEPDENQRRTRREPEENLRRTWTWELQLRMAVSCIRHFQKNLLVLTSWSSRSAGLPDPEWTRRPISATGVLLRPGAKLVLKVRHLWLRDSVHMSD